MAAEHHRHAMNQFRARRMFRLVAEDVGVIGDSQFSASVFTYSRDTGPRGHAAIATIFTAMARKDADRGVLPARPPELPYLGSGCFAGEMAAPSFEDIPCRSLRDLNCGKINPDICGSMIQSAAHPWNRSELGM